MTTKLRGSIIVTYRCNARCNMCDVWHHPTKPAEEIGLDVIEKLPEMFFTNITGGEVFCRQDLPEIVALLRTKTRRIVISTNGYFTDKIIALCEKYPDLGIRISIEGLQQTNDAIRGIPDGYNRTIKTLNKLHEMGIKDIGFGTTIQDMNAKDLLPLYEMAKKMGYEFATATQCRSGDLASSCQAGFMGFEAKTGDEIADEDYCPRHPGLSQRPGRGGNPLREPFPPSGRPRL